MSKTDKDRPMWVINAEHGLIDHDHRDGVCIVSNDQRERWGSWRTHRNRCRKRVREEYTCEKNDPVRPRYYVWREDPARLCWNQWVDEEGYHTTGCLGHVRYVRDESIPCSCDDRPEPATCFPTWVAGRHYTYGGVPSEFVRATYHRPERAREREGLDRARRLYNAGDDLNDYDFDNRQARNSCRWLYW